MHGDPGWYSKLSDDYKRETQYVMGRFWERMEWDSGENLLDVGCGTGDALYHVIRSRLPDDYNSIVGVDISPEMVAFARSKWKDPRLSFKELDIGTLKDPLMFFDKQIKKAGGFHKITSFFCLQWVKDRRRMLQNLYRLLRPGGSALLLLVVRSGIYQVWDDMAQRERWRPYLQEMNQPVNDYVYMENYQRVFCEAAEAVGFKIVGWEVLDRKDVFAAHTNTDDEMIVRIRTVDPFVHLIPEDLKMEYLKEVLSKVKTDVSPRGATDYTGLLVLLKKPTEQCP